MCAVFHAMGKRHYSIAEFNILVNGEARISAMSFNILTGI